MRVENFKDLVPGKWYLCVVYDEAGEPNYDQAPIYQYLGDGGWADENENSDNIWVYDPVCGYRVTPNECDEWVQQ